jgi:restriction endonuclease fold toxin 7 of polymorphic toxin system
MPATASSTDPTASGRWSQLPDQPDPSPADPSFVLDLGDGLPLIAIARLLRSAIARQSSSTGGDLSSAGALADWLEVQVADQSVTGDNADPVAAYAPFATAAEIVEFLVRGPTLQSGPPPNIRGAPTYRDAIEAAFGADVAAVSLGAVPPGESALMTRVAAELVATCGLCCIPVQTVAAALEDAEAYRFLSSVALALQDLRAQLESGIAARTQRVVAPLSELLRTEQLAMLRAKLGDIQAAGANLQPERESGVPPNKDFSGADVFAGALFEMRSDCIELHEQLASANTKRETFTSTANRLGIGEPIVIDHRERLAKLRSLEPKVQEWITETLELAARTPEDSESLATRLDQIALAIGLIETLLGVIQVSQSFIDATSKHDLASDLLPYAVNLESMLPLIESTPTAGRTEHLEKVREYLDEASSQTSAIITSDKWSHIVFRAVSAATDIVTAIETGGSMGGMAGAVRAEAAMGSATGRAMAGAIADVQIERILSGAVIVAKSKAAKLASARARAIGKRGKKGEIEANTYGKPKTPIESITGKYTKARTKIRIPDALTARLLKEVKNVRNLVLTRQLRDFIMYAGATGRRFELWIRPSIKGAKVPGTTLSSELKALLSEMNNPKFGGSPGTARIRYFKKGTY